MYHTLQDFMTFTKGFSYVLGGLFLVVFIPYWLFLTEREKKE